MRVVCQVVFSLPALAILLIRHSEAFVFLTPLLPRVFGAPHPQRVSSAASDSSPSSVWRMSGTTHAGSNQPTSGTCKPLENSSPSREYFQVVTAVVQDKGTGRILALKRSKEVRSFAEHWHFISGGMEEQDEGDVVKRAYQELEEEVKLEKEDLELRAKGRPLLVHDSRGRALLIHPLLLYCLRPLCPSPSSSEGGAAAAGGPIGDGSLNWENTELQWVTMPQLREGGLRLVPRLLETAERVLHAECRGPWPNRVQEALRHIEDDRDHGAMQLAGWAVQALATWADTRLLHSDGATVAPSGGVEADLRDLGYTLANTRPAMAALGNAVATVVNRALEVAVGSNDQYPMEVAVGGGPTGGQAARSLLQAVKEAAAEFERDTAEASRALIEEATAEIRRRMEAHRQGTGAGRRFTIITLSLSSTLTRLFRRLAEPPGSASQVHVVVCESRPLLEGGKLATLLIGLGYHVTLITDAQMGVFAACSDVALLGADAIHPGGDTAEAQVVNKVGSLPLSLCCRHMGVPVVGVTSSLKVSPWPAGPGLQGEEKGADEVTATAAGLQGMGQGPTGVRVRNVYFEGVPLSLLDAVVVEGGPLGGDGVRALAEKRRAAFEAAFFGAR